MTITTDQRLRLQQMTVDKSFAEGGRKVSMSEILDDLLNVYDAYQASQAIADVLKPNDSEPDS